LRQIGMGVGFRGKKLAAKAAPTRTRVFGLAMPEAAR
jgi:hypothetical protein